MAKSPNNSDLSSITVSNSTMTELLSIEDDDSSAVDVPPDELSERGKAKYDDTKKLLELEVIADRQADRDLRERFGDKAYNVVRKTLYGWAVVLAATAFCKFFFDKDIFSENVLVAITSAVTLNTFAAFLGVIRGLFPSNRKTAADEDK